MVSRGCTIAGFVLVCASVVLVPLGTYLQTQAPQFPEYEQHVLARIAAAYPKSGVGPAGMFAFAWEFAACICAFIGLLYTGGSLLVLGLVWWRREAGLLAAGAFGLGCMVGVVLECKEALESFRWGFTVLGLGKVLLAAGLGLGALGAVGGCRTSRCSRPATRITPVRGATPTSA